MSFFPRLAFILLISLSLLFVSGINGCPQKVQPEISAESTEKAMGETLSGNEVEITSQGFSPNTLTINVGDTVTWINKDDSKHWPASAMHPTHTVYPETGGCIGSKFDACKGLEKDEAFEFTFNEKGTWKYHDHLNPGLTGSITVN